MRFDDQKPWFAAVRFIFAESSELRGEAFLLSRPQHSQ
jgi:hypothetical protein